MMQHNYQNGKIYKIISRECPEVFIGSTIYRLLCTRMAVLRGAYKAFQEHQPKAEYYNYFEILKYNDAQIILIENYPCKSIDELHARVAYWVDRMDCINKRPLTPEEKLIRKRLNDNKYKKETTMCNVCECSIKIGSRTIHNKSQKHKLNVEIKKLRSELSLKVIEDPLQTTVCS